MPAVSLNEDIDTNKELVAHGYSNLLAGVFGSVYVCSDSSYEGEISLDFLYLDQIILFT